MHKPSTNISSFIDDLVPQHVNENYPELIKFIKVYALYLERVNKSSFYLNNLAQQRDIDLIEEHLLTELQNEIGTPIPRTFAADPRLFYKNLVGFYRSRGTTESIEAFFKLIYDDEVDIYFPKEDMFIPSNGRWHDQKADIIANPGDFTPRYTWTIASPTNRIDFNSDAGFPPKLDDSLIFINDVYHDKAHHHEHIYYEDDEIKYALSFHEDILQIGDVVKSYPKGLFLTNDGFLSDGKYIQDSYFYQKFSYVLKTGKNIDDWKNAFTRLIHPAGFIFFGEILIFIEYLESMNDELQPGNQDSGLPLNINISPVEQPLIASELGTYVEKEYAYIASLSRFGMWNHVENTKFFNWRPMREFGDYTIQDVINNNIGLQLGSRIWTCSPNDLATDTSYNSTQCTIQTT
jgi:hypothetical protein